MPITAFQHEVLHLLKKHRNPNSYVAGGIAIHRSDSSFRRSNDIDFFHDTDEAVSQGAELDRRVLQGNGYDVVTLIEQPAFVRAVINKGQQSLRLEWVRDTAFRFFPVIEDDDLGYRLHDVDLTVNKCLTLANRSEVRDIVDLIQLDHEVLSLTAACWAACGKDPGFTPLMLLDCMNRNSIIRPEQLSAESFARKISAIDLKKEWLKLHAAAREELPLFPVDDLGCIYLDARGRVVCSPNPRMLADSKRHFGSVGGSWPRAVTA